MATYGSSYFLSAARAADRSGSVGLVWAAAGVAAMTASSRTVQRRMSRPLMTDGAIERPQQNTLRPPARLLHEFRQFPEAERGIAGEALLQPAQVAISIYDEDPLGRAVHQPSHVAEDPDVALEPLGHEVRAGPIPGLAEVRLPEVESHFVGGVGVAVDQAQGFEHRVRRQILVERLHVLAEARHRRVELLGLAAGLGVVDDVLKGKLAVDVHRIHARVTQHLGEAESELLDLVAG